jgi:dephospho-CoA kinase
VAGAGKSTLLNIVRGIMGGYCKQADPEMFMVKRGTYYSTNDVAKAGKHKAEQNAQYTVRELQQLVSSASALKERHRLQ